MEGRQRAGQWGIPIRWRSGDEGKVIPEERIEVWLDARAREASTGVPIGEAVCPWVMRRLQVGSRGWTVTEEWGRKRFLCCTQGCHLLQMHFLFLCWSWNLETRKYNWVQETILEGTESKTSKKHPRKESQGKEEPEYLSSPTSTAY